MEMENGSDQLLSSCIPGCIVVDLRSDVLTKPSAAMWESIMTATTGDDVFQEDDTTNELQRRCAELLGKEDGLFIMSGTMSNLLAILAHCQERGAEMLIGDQSHICLNEQGGAAQFGGVFSRTLTNLPDGTFDINQLMTMIKDGRDPHNAKTVLVCLENTHNFCGGKILPLDFSKQVWKLCQECGIKVHLDGARLWNSAVALKTTLADLAQYSDTVSICFSKGMGCPIGSVLVGPRTLVDRARRLRKAMGGGTRQPGLLAAAAIHALDNILPILHHDHEKAKKLALAIMGVSKSAVSIDLDGVQTNMFMVDMVKQGLTAQSFIERLLQVTPDEENSLKERIIVKIFPVSAKTVRFVTRHDLTDKDIEKAIKKCVYVVEELAALSS